MLIIREGLDLPLSTVNPSLSTGKDFLMHSLLRGELMMNRMAVLHQNSGAIGRFTHSRCPSHFISQLLRLVLASPCASFKIKGEEQKWLIAQIKRNISHFRFCIKESNHPFSPFSTFSTLSKFSLLLSPSPCLSHKLQYDNI